jgi:hypothetical protein
MRRKSIGEFALVVAIVVIGVVAYFTIANHAGVEYRNSQYGFSVSLPKTWKGYSVVAEKWIGYTNGAQGQVASQQGAEILVRHPLWTAGHVRQDIPIMVFTLAQWDLIQKEEFYVSAAPIGPSELGRNATYVFGLPPRYNYAYITGWEEVESILKANSFHTF